MEESARSAQSAAKRLNSKRERTKEALINAAIALISEKGVADTTVLDITQSLQISNGTFYYHFQKIDQLLEEVGHRIVIRLVQQIGRVKRVDPAAQVARGPMVILRFCARNPQLRAIMLHVMDDPDKRHEELEDNLHADIQRGQRVARFAVEDIGLAVKLCRSINISALRYGDSLELTQEGLALQAAAHTLSMLGVPMWEAHEIAVRELYALDGEAEN